MQHLQFYKVNQPPAYGFSMGSTSLGGWQSLVFSGSKENVSYPLNAYYFSYKLTNY